MSEWDPEASGTGLEPFRAAGIASVTGSPFGSEGKVEAYTHIVDLLLEELAVGRRPVVVLSEETPHPRRVVLVPPGGHLQPGTGAPPGLPVLLLRGLHVYSSQESEAPKLTDAELEPGVTQSGLQRFRLPVEEELPAAIGTQGTQLLGKEKIQRFEGEVLPLDIRAQEKLVSKVRALVVDPETGGESGPPERDGHPHQVICIDQVEGLGIQVELGEDTPDQADLNSITRRSAGPTYEGKCVTDSDGGDSDIGVRSVPLQRWKLPAQNGNERMLRLGVSQERTEQIALRKEDGSFDLPGVNSREAPGSGSLGKSDSSSTSEFSTPHLGAWPSVFRLLASAAPCPGRVGV
jgi:hypothetical protein